MPSFAPSALGGVGVFTPDPSARHRPLYGDHPILSGAVRYGEIIPGLGTYTGASASSGAFTGATTPASGAYTPAPAPGSGSFTPTP